MSIFCKHCKQSFNFICHFYSHITTAHKNDTQYICCFSNCYKIYSLFSSLKIHIKKIHFKISSFESITDKNNNNDNNNNNNDNNNNDNNIEIILKENDAVPNEYTNVTSHLNDENFLDNSLFDSVTSESEPLSSSLITVISNNIESDIFFGKEFELYNELKLFATHLFSNPSLSRKTAKEILSFIGKLILNIDKSFLENKTKQEQNLVFLRSEHMFFKFLKEADVFNFAKSVNLFKEIETVKKALKKFSKKLNLT
jgi:hypothetical protein